MRKEFRIMTSITEATIERFGRYLYNEEKSNLTIEKYLRDVRAFSDYLGENDLTKEAMMAYKQRLISDGFSVRSINSMIASINKLAGFLGREELKVKTVRLQKEIFRPEEKELTRAEYERLCRTAEEKRNCRLSLIIQTICGTGIRISELEFITVDAVKRGEARVSCKGKTREIFIVKALREKLMKYVARHQITEGCVFVTRNGKPVSRVNVWREMKVLCGDAHVNPSKVFPHNLRHLFARVFYEIEKDIAKLADILGHSSINTTRIYIISTGKEHRRRMENMRLIL